MKRITLCILIFLLSLSSILPTVNASGITQKDSNLSNPNQPLPKIDSSGNIKKDISNEVESFKNIVSTMNPTDKETTYKKTIELVRSKELKTTINFKNIKSYQAFNLNKYKMKMIQFQIELTDSKVHTFGVLYDQDGKVVKYEEIILSKLNDKQAHIKTLANGKENIDKDYEIKGSENTPNKKFKSWWAAMNYCWANVAPIPDWIQDGLTYACSAICIIGVAAPACMACLLAIGAAYSFELGYCSAWAIRHS